MQGTSASTRIRYLRGRTQLPPEDLRRAIDQFQQHAADLREALAAIRAAEDRDESKDAVSVPAGVIDQLDAGIKRVRAELAQLKAEIAPPREEVSGERDQVRMVALNMALNGASRAETDRYLHESFGLRDRQPILDDAYERVQRLRGENG
jgi:hypothetical protein